MNTVSQTVLTQLRKGALENCVLASLQQGPAYGLELASRLSKYNMLFTTEGTLYPLLSRLRKQGLVETTWQESASGPPRRYYQLTDQGHASLAVFTATWVPFRDDVDSLLAHTPPGDTTTLTGDIDVSPAD